MRIMHLQYKGESFCLTDGTPNSVVQRLSEISHEGGQIAMTTATRLHQEG